MLQGHPIQELHRDKWVTLVLANVMNSANVWMIESGSGLRFTLETSQSLRISSNFIRQELQCNEAMQPGVLGLKDHTHAAAAELLDDTIVRNGLADHSGRLASESPYLTDAASASQRMMG